MIFVYRDISGEDKASTQLAQASDKTPNAETRNTDESIVKIRQNIEDVLAQAGHGGSWKEAKDYWLLHADHPTMASLALEEYYTEVISNLDHASPQTINKIPVEDMVALLRDMKIHLETDDDDNLPGGILRVFKHVHDSHKKYFVKLFIEQLFPTAFKTPFENASPAKKRELLHTYHLESLAMGYSESRIDRMSDEEVEIAFVRVSAAWRDTIAQQLTYERQSRMKDRFADVSSLYDATPDPKPYKQWNFDTQSARPATYKELMSISACTRLTPHYGMIYAGDDPERVFALRPKDEPKVLEAARAELGTDLSIEELLSLTNSEETLLQGIVTPSPLKSYILLRSRLPADLVQKFEREFNLAIPRELDLRDTTPDQKHNDLPDEPWQQFIEQFEAFSSEEESEAEGALIAERRLSELVQPLIEAKKAKRLKTEFVALDDIVKRESLGAEILSQEELRNLVADYKTLMTMGTRQKLEEAVHLGLEHLTLRAQLQFLKLLKERNEKEVAEIFEFLNRAGSQAEKIDRFNAFLALESEPRMAQTILDLGKLPPRKAKAIFQKFADIQGIFQEQEAELREKMQENKVFQDKVSMTKLYRTITKRGIRLLSDFASHVDKISDADKYLEEARAYNREVVAFGSLFTTVSTMGDELPSPEAIGGLAENVRVEMIKSGGLIRSDSPEAMLKPTNYTRPERFSCDDYKMIVRNLEKAYSEIDPNWLRYLIKGIARDLLNPKVTFLLVKNKKGELVGVTKRKDMGNKHFYVGTLYVDEEYQRDFGIGQYLSRYIRQTMPAGSTVEATVAAANTAASRHIDILGAVGDQITFEGEGDERSNELIRTIKPQQKFLTKDKKAYPESRLHQMAHSANDNSGNIQVLFTDTSRENVKDFTSELSEWFEQGYYLTRFFYDQGDQKKTYLTLEKPESGRRTAEVQLKKAA